MSAVSAASIASIEKKTEYKGEPRRWFVLFVVTIGQLMGNLIFSTMNPLAIEVSRAF